MSDISTVSSSQGVNPYNGGGRIDPYTIFQLNFEALGGEKNVKYDRNFLYQGELQMNNNTFQIKEYISKPNRFRREISSNFKVVYKSGDDGFNIWDEQNGNVTSIPDGDTKERKIRKLWDEYAYTDPKNREFTAIATRKVSIDGTPCYEIKIRNRTTEEMVTQYYDTETFMLKRELQENGNSRLQTNYSDYRDVGNIKMAFRKETTNLNTNGKSIYQWDKIEKGVYISDSMFYAPEGNEKLKEYEAMIASGKQQVAKGGRVNTYA